MKLFSLFSLSVFALVLGLSPHKAMSQEQLPDFSLPQIIAPEELETLDFDYEGAFASIDNDFLSDSIKINYQMALLQKLIDRQAEIDKIRETYATLGADFVEPAPPYKICAQLPVNAPCLKHYPDLYNNTVAERRDFYKELEKKLQRPEVPENISSDDPEALERARREAAAKEKERQLAVAEEERKTRYQWSDITCAVSQCQGVIVKPKETGYRTTVQEGTRLPDGSLIQSVSADGIRIIIDGQAIQLRPSPVTQDTQEIVQDVPDLEALKNALSNEATDAASNVIANAQNETQKNTASAPQGQTIVEPELGPSGLF